ncbi:MAG TPA: hypothetical protein HPP59_07260 [Deltaproteobacteria bacterium]|nr:hypothetical protein [Deltaproteobacteria bacterium]
MKVICPKCGAVYNVDDSEIPDKGVRKEEIGSWRNFKCFYLQFFLVYHGLCYYAKVDQIKSIFRRIYGL